jgi:hypothetical protein
VQSPIIIFDHINKVVTAVPAGAPADDRRVAEILAAQRDQVATSTGRPRP